MYVCYKMDEKQTSRCYHGTENFFKTISTVVQNDTHIEFIANEQMQRIHIEWSLDYQLMVRRYYGVENVCVLFRS